MAKIVLVIGTTYGNAEDAGLACADFLRACSHQVVVSKSPTLALLDPDTFDVLLVCTATIGMGELPDNIAGFYEALAQSSLVFADKRYGVIALGDSGYEDFANAGILMDECLSQRQMECVGEVCYIDACDSLDATEPALEWLAGWEAML